MAAHFAYLLWSRGGKRFYVGVSTDPASRVAKHNARGGHWSARFRPWALVWKSEPLSFEMACELERLIKAQHGGKGLFSLTGLDPSLFDH